MKKILLSAVALIASMNFVSAQAFSNGDPGYTQSFGSAGTSCLKAFTNAGYQWPDGNIASATNDANAITITCVGSSTLASGKALGLFDIYASDNTDCKAMRTIGSGVGVDMSANTRVTFVMKASKEVKAIIGLSSTTLTNYPAASTSSISVPVAQTLVTIGTTECEYTVDFSSTEFTGAAWKNKINIWGLSFDGTVTANADAVVTITAIKFGANANAASDLDGENCGNTTSSSSANVVNDQVVLFPNPAKGNFTVDMTAMNNTEAAVVKVLNANGTVVSEVSTSSATYSVNTANMNKGIYLVQITSGNKVATQRVVVE